MYFFLPVFCRCLLIKIKESLKENLFVLPYSGVKAFYRRQQPNRNLTTRSTSNILYVHTNFPFVIYRASIETTEWIMIMFSTLNFQRRYYLAKPAVKKLNNIIISSKTVVFRRSFNSKALH